MIQSKPERGQCEHGKFYWMNWEWDEKIGETIEDSIPVFGSNGCQTCKIDSEK